MLWTFAIKLSLYSICFFLLNVYHFESLAPLLYQFLCCLIQSLLQQLKVLSAQCLSLTLYWILDKCFQNGNCNLPQYILNQWKLRRGYEEKGDQKFLKVKKTMTNLAFVERHNWTRRSLVLKLIMASERFTSPQKKL